MKLSVPQVADYLSRRFDDDIEVESLRLLGDKDVQADGEYGGGALKTFGYGEPILVTYQHQGEQQKAVLSTVASNHFGHEDRADRAAEIVRSYEIYNTLPQHARAIDIGIMARDNHLQSLAGGKEFFLLTEHVGGQPYARDLERIRNTGQVTGLDLRRAFQLAKYLAEIHLVKRNDPPLYVRRIRDTFGSGEGIMGLADSYPANCDFVTPEWLEKIEGLCVSWRWKLKEKSHRLTQVHGDFHPYNLLFDRGIDFNVLDRSRGDWGEPADDVICMAINYLFFSLQRSGKLAPPFEQLWNIFWNTYLQESGDSELTSVIAPFFAWRALVLASPIWYNVDDSVRQSLVNAIESILSKDVFDPTTINELL